MTEIVTAARAPRLDARPFVHRIGLVTLSTDHTIEADFARIVAPRGIGVHANRIAFANPVTPETLAAMQPDLAEDGGAMIPMFGDYLDAVSTDLRGTKPHAMFNLMGARMAEKVWFDA